MDSQKITVDDMPIVKFHIRAMVLTFGAHFNDGYILGLIAIAFTLLTPDMQLDAFWQGMIGSSCLFGLFVGSLICGPISDRYGRQKIYNYSFIAIAVGSALQFFVDGPVSLVLCRILIGMGIGGDYSVGATILVELCPKKPRGVLVGSFSVFWTLGFVTATFCGLGILKLGLGNDAWRWILASSTIPSVIMLALRYGFPESPRWLVNHGRQAEADAILHKYLGPNIILADEVIDPSHAGFMELFSKKYLTRTVFNCIFYSFLVMPYFAIYTFLPQILQVMNLTEGFGTEMLLNGMLFVGSLLGILFTIIFSRRFYAISNAFLILVALILLGVLPSEQHVLLVLSFVVLTLLLSAISNLTAIFPAESFPTEVRAGGIGFATAMSRLASAAATFILPSFMGSFGASATMMTLAGMIFILLVSTILWAPETKNLTLAQAGGRAGSSGDEPSPDAA
jgi:Arabinose efflux permease